MSKDRLIIAGLMMCLIVAAIPLVLADTSKDGTLFNNSSDKITSIQSGDSKANAYDRIDNAKIIGTHCGVIIDDRAGTYSVCIKNYGWRTIRTGDVNQNQAILQLCCDAYTSGKLVNIGLTKSGAIVDVWTGGP
ncbi:hypothetical protein RG963_15365 [Methanosarcina sp. Z-7115]|uniref:Uncharacterized protein n=1 Tax=Methanosarcina baikalica TaxID=3073890 RepID=A0ABU2D5C7_9EURY|nr:hypothetical protein [Methanosarcina sp. Z-7115]MDR7667127.1 hypothetical protein [Methanosarcina sp. Z-7115]